MYRTLSICLTLLVAATATAQFDEKPFRSQAELAVVDGTEQLRIRIGVPENHHLYKDGMEATVQAPEGASLRLLAASKTKRKYDEGFEKDVDIFEEDAVLVYEVRGRGDATLEVELAYQGCSGSTCFPPELDAFAFASATGTAAIPLPREPEAPANAESSESLDELLAHFHVGGQESGYMAPDKFLGFLDEAESGQAAGEDERIVQRVFRRYGLIAVLLLLIPLGFMLNLTPCVLPMIPINLAIIGAGAQAGTKRRGFALGSVYGAGMAAVYGILGLVVVLTGSSFGALNSSPWFNLAVAVVFVLLALAMFDLYVIDLSRFKRRSAGSGDTSRSPFVTAFFLGGTAALLAGACVAPVLLSVLVLAANLYRSNPFALLLPFMLGVGMALPWPFAGAGLSFLPKPGGWMDWVKRIFGVLILLMALYYGMQALRLFQRPSGNDAHGKTELATALKRGIDENKPVLLDFWAISCTACKKMDRDVFPEERVAERLGDFVFVKVQADLKDDQNAQWAVRTFEVRGWPTYVVLVPGNGK